MGEDYKGIGADRIQSLQAQLADSIADANDHRQRLVYAEAEVERLRKVIGKIKKLPTYDLESVGYNGDDLVETKYSLGSEYHGDYVDAYDLNNLLKGGE